MEKQLITETLALRNGNRKQASKDLGINISTLYRKIKKLAIEPPNNDGRGKRH